MSDMVRAGIVRILRESDQQAMGVGFLVDGAKRTILTCAHVVNAAIGNVNNQDKPRSLITVDFPFLINGQQYDCRVLDFYPKNASGAGDIAVLEIVEPLPETAKAVRLTLAENYNGHEFGVYGFPQGFEESGQYVEGRLQERLANKRIQAIGTTNLGYFVEHGFSGSPVIDKQLNAVIGMMMQVDTEANKRISFLSPVDVLAELFTDLKFEKLTVPNITLTQSDAGIEPSGKWLQRVDIFISSPSDVAEEREAMLRVIERLNRLSSIRSRYILNPLLYEKEVPPEAGDHAQMIVDRYMAVEDSYLLICLMWNRMGTPFTHPKTGEAFQSGTEYEFTVGYRANGKNGQPHLLLYRKTTEQTDTDKSEKEKVDNFFKRFEGKEATFKGLYKPFSSLSEFENMLFEHIERILHDNPPDTSRPDNRVDPDTRPDILEETRRLDAAMPRECHVGRSTEVRVMICLPGSAGLRALLPDYTTEGDLIDKRDVREGNLAIAFPVDKKSGKPQPILVTVEAKSEDFSISDSAQDIQLSLTQDSGLLIFSARPKYATKRGRVHIIVKSKTPDGYTVVIGSISINSTISTSKSNRVMQVIWNVITFPLTSFAHVDGEGEKPSNAKSQSGKKFYINSFNYLELGTLAIFGIDDESLMKSVVLQLIRLGSHPKLPTFSRHGESSDQPVFPVSDLSQLQYGDLELNASMTSILDRIFAIFLIKSTNNSQDKVFAYINIRLDRLSALLEKESSKVPFDLAEYSTIVQTGYGEIPYDVKEKMERDYLFGKDTINIRLFPPLDQIT